MHSNHWLYSWKTLVLASILFPPLGLVLVWLRPSTRLSRRILTSIYISVLAFFYLHQFAGLRVERDGSGWKPMFSFEKGGETHDVALERDRARHAKLPLSQPIAEDVSSSAPSIAPESVKSVAAPPIPPSSPLAEQEPVPKPSSAYWTEFRGPKRDGVYDEMDILTTWPAQGLPQLWKQPVGGGYASFVVARGMAFTIEQRRNQEVVAAYDLKTGRELWTNSWDADFRESMGGDGPRATPTWHEDRLYALGALGELRCLDARTGKLLWNHNILSDAQAGNLQWGMSAAPLVVDDKVIVLPGGRPGKSVVAYNKDTGSLVWQALDDKQAYTSPALVTLAGQRQILMVSAQRVAGLAPEDGKVLWDFPWVTSYDVNSAQPLVIGENRVFISAGYGHGAALIEVTRPGDSFSARLLWQNGNMKNKFNSSVYYQGHIYGLDEAILSCLNAETGERKWKGGRYGYGQLLLARGYLIILTESGEVVLVKATPENHVEVSRFSAIEGRTWNNPALANGRLLVRNTTEMACFKISK
jgi:outer membrane protein assembly factor BamB